MSYEVLFVLALVAVTIILFASERWPVDLVALLVLVVLLATRIITPEQGLAGFGNAATVTVAAMFVLSAGLFRTGAVSLVGDLLRRLAARNFYLTLIVIMVTTGIISTFLNNTAVVAIFMPVVLAVARDVKVSASRMLMPLSFASMFGGVCTLIGTSTNILVNTIAVDHGQRAFGMFEFARLGVVFMVVGVAYMALVGIRMIPDRRREGDLTRTFDMGQYLTEIVLLPDAESVGRRLDQAPLVHELELEVLDLSRDKVSLAVPPGEMVLQANDVLRVRCDVDRIRRLQERQGVILKPNLSLREADFDSEQAMLVEAVISPNSVLVSKSLKELKFRQTFGATALAIRHDETVIREKLGRIKLRAGDVLLIEVRRDHLNQLKQNNAFVIVSESGLSTFRRGKMVRALAILAFVVGTAALNVFPIVVSALIGCFLLILSRCLTLQELYNSVEWSVIFLLAGVLTLGIALEETGAAELIATALINLTKNLGPSALVSGLFLLTMFLTNIMSNAATAALLAPIAIVIADTLALDARPFLMAVTFAASLSFITPVGYQTNTLIYGPGQFKFMDFVRVGAPLNLIFWLIGSYFIPRLWPF